MSSSRRKSSRRARAPKCPVCSSGPVVAVEVDVVLRVKGRSYRFERVKHEVCQACGERIFGLEVSRRFDERILSRGKTGAV
jgi:YgiT-type zinc finger domain-containing protein